MLCASPVYENASASASKSRKSRRDKDGPAPAASQQQPASQSVFSPNFFSSLDDHRFNYENVQLY